MAIVKQYHKDTNTTYVYESESYWDAEKGQSRSRRRVIGKLDPETGEIIPTGKRGRKKKDFTHRAWKRSRPWKHGSAPLNSRSPDWNAGMKNSPP